MLLQDVTPHLHLLVSERKHAAKLLWNIHSFLLALEGMVTLKTQRIFFCILYGIDGDDVAGINGAMRTLFVKAKRALEMLPPTRDALELHVSRANYQAKIWLDADKSIMDFDNIKPADTIGWTEGLNVLEIVWKRLPAVPEACLELISCGCKKKCVSV